VVDPGLNFGDGMEGAKVQQVYKLAKHSVENASFAVE